MELQQVLWHLGEELKNLFLFLSSSTSSEIGQRDQYMSQDWIGERKIEEKQIT